MMQRLFRNRVVHRASAAGLLALAFAGALPAHARQEAPAPAAASQAAEDAEQKARELRRAKAREMAEKKRAEREAREQHQAENSGGKAATDIEPVTQDVSKEVENYIHAAMGRLGLDASKAASAAGFVIGAAGPSLYSKMVGAAPDAAEELVLEIAGAGEDYLEKKYVSALKMGALARYGLFAVLALSLALYARRFLPAQSRRRRSTSSTTKDTTMFRLPKIFGRKTPQVTSEPTLSGNPILVDYDMDVLKDYAVNLLFARGRHDLSGCHDMVTANLNRVLDTYFKNHEARGQWNKVERVSGVQCREIESWLENDTSFVKMLVTWKAIDYVVNYNRKPNEHGFIVEGRPNVLDNFSEEWTVVRRAGESWLVDVMCPATRH